MSRFLPKRLPGYAVLDKLGTRRFVGEQLMDRVVEVADARTATPIMSSLSTSRTALAVPECYRHRTIWAGPPKFGNCIDGRCESNVSVLVIDCHEHGPDRRRGIADLLSGRRRGGDRMIGADSIRTDSTGPAVPGCQDFLMDHVP